MGNARWDPDDWRTRASANAGRTRTEIFNTRGTDAAFDPRNFSVRESRDSEANPAAYPIILALDVTGSMGHIPEMLVKDGLGTLVQEVLGRKPVPDPHLMIAAVGDVQFDRAPLQATQFEADPSLADQLSRLYLEGGGGANMNESYHLPWLLAATRTATDHAEKRGGRGALFTVGDELPPPELTPDQVRSVFGDANFGQPLPTADVLAMAQRRYDVFHIVVQEGHNYARDPRGVHSAWKELLGQNVIPLADYRRLPEVVVSTLQVVAGEDPAGVARSWGGDAARAVEHAVSGLPARGSDADAGGAGLVRL